MDDSDVLAALALNALPSVSPLDVSRLIAHFGSASAAAAAYPSGWRDVPQVRPDLAACAAPMWSDAQRTAHQDADRAAARSIRLFFLHAGPYPALLREIPAPPPVLYVQGDDIAVPEPVAIAIVGSRRSSFYGERAAARFGKDFARRGVVTVSGLARGIDTHAHQAALSAGGRTWAVAGSGLGRLYPPENRALAQAIAESGALVSEFPMDTAPFPPHFPRRNRVIAGLTLGTLVVEGGETSGSLITARLAAEFGRSVFAVPGPIGSPSSAAPHRLLREGAVLADSIDAVLGELGFQTMPGGAASPARPVPERFADVWAAVGELPLAREELCLRLKKDAADLAALLLEMEVDGWIRSLPGGGVARAIST